MIPGAHAERPNLEVAHDRAPGGIPAFHADATPHRSAQLITVPAADRQMVGDHLRQWDRLSPVQQKEIIDYETTMQALRKPTRWDRVRRCQYHGPGARGLDR